jgi:hypothetical protein
MRQREYEWFQKRDGHLDEALWTAYRGVILLHLGTPRTRQWWLDSGRAVFEPEFSAMVDQLLDGREASTAYVKRSSTLTARPELATRGAPHNKELLLRGLPAG